MGSHSQKVCGDTQNTRAKGGIRNGWARGDTKACSPVLDRSENVGWQIIMGL